MLHVTPTAQGIRLTVHVQPRAKAPGVGGLHGDALKVRVSAAPVDGAANEAVVRAIADAFGRAARDVRVVAGASARRKIVEVDGATIAAAMALAVAGS
ncbi:MAG TPA: DUF167 domain-containing protein [Gemmatimonadaceae bacterium]|nr:DUF167 domain-containing protein [Gemmatimonadaceae bacterium]HRQ77222.1 DUF167 domain-containing protein [Gemmatimonadaceae bacterium]